MKIITVKKMSGADDPNGTSITTAIIKPGVSLSDLKEESPLTVYVLPISGGSFVAQIALLSELYEAKWITKGRKWNGSKDYQPDLVLAASGGNVATYIALAGDWSPQGMLRICSKFDSKIFLRSWWPEHLDFIPTWLLAPFNGSMFRPGDGADELFRSMFTPTTIQRTEIWTGTYDATHSRAQFFCNKTHGTTLINPDHFNRAAAFYGCMPLRCLDGDVSKIAVASVASASIPYLVSQQQLDGSNYADGGAMYPSPLAAMSSELYRLIQGSNAYQTKLINEFLLSHHVANSSQKNAATVPKPPGAITPPKTAPAITGACTFTVDHKTQTVSVSENTKLNDVGALGRRALRLVYICCYEMDVPKGVYDIDKPRTTHAIRSVLHANELQDRAAAVQLLMRICGEDGANVKYSHYAQLDRDQLAEILTELESCRHYIIAIYPHGVPQISLMSFTPASMEAAITTTRQHYGAYVWSYSSS